jgi:hypothetical protein
MSPHIFILSRSNAILTGGAGFIVRRNPDDAWWIERSLESRRKVLVDFNRLVRDGLAVLDLPELGTIPVAAAAAVFVAHGWSWRYASVHRPKMV